MREMQKIPFRASRMVLSAPERRRGALIALVAAVAMTVAGAFGTGTAPFLQRLAYWVLLMAAGAALAVPVNAGMTLWGKLTAKPLAEASVVSLAIAVPLTLVVLLTTLVFFGARQATASAIASLFLVVLLTSALMTGLRYGFRRNPAEISPGAGLAKAATAPRRPYIFRRLPTHLREARLYALQAEDHYVRVHTSAGSDLILMRLSDALAELDPVEGARTHRSWWVARAAVLRAERRNGGGELTVAGGLVVPVSRSVYAGLKARGWFVSNGNGQRDEIG